MAISTVTEKWVTPTYDRDNDKRNARRIFTVQTTTDNEPLTTIEDAPGVPSRGESFPGDFYLQVKRKRVKQFTDRAFEVTVEYEARVDGEDEENTDPLSQPAQISYSAVYYQEPADVDVDGDQIGTFNDEPFDPPIMVDQADMVISVTRNIGGFVPSTLSQYMNTINSDNFLGFAPRQLRVVGIRADKVTDTTPHYHRVTVDIQAKNTFDEIGLAIGWDKRLLHQGFRVWTGNIKADGSREMKHAEDSNGNRVTEPVLIRGADGRRTAPGEQKSFVRFQVYKEQAFATMNFGV